MEPRGRVLVVDDKENILKLFARLLGDTYEVTCAEDGARALALVAAQEFDVVVSDVRMPGADGFEVLRAVKSRHPDTEVVMMTGYATVPDAVEAMRAGAFDYLQKPFLPDAPVELVARAMERRRLRLQAESLGQKSPGSDFAFAGAVGRSAAMQEAHRLLEQAARLDITVLLTGETGTGKELAARAVHLNSARREKPFVAVNCGALPAELVESELFGHGKGAFTGAAQAKAGLFEEAHGGTLFLDEVGELPLNAQVKLLRVLQEREVRRVGETRPVQVDVRVVAATHRDLRAAAAQGRFREDLFYRLNVFPVQLPPLRERKEDIPLLAAHLLDKHCKAMGRSLEGMTPEALRTLVGYPWPGNVRELENALMRAVAVATGPVVTERDLPQEVRERQEGALPGGAAKHLPYRDALDLARDRFSREYLTALLRDFEGNVTRAAEHAGIERESLHRLLKRYSIRSDDFKPR
ncbi:two component Fis family sigma54 specific transcriptional regulator [Archangium gephyra]|uniref:Response regulator of zinc sigma-54-dependent two-component system n=1 Tax=Archangium gephyra TaxID=48 RepID=A0AAC8TD02_9BACT|nr:sigma-54 dependent transcriptional regulator [Archangium gephyra]AKI99940.1 Response regulator of zinc sigma-54-dependent two-component system [Archangium gephyra]REG33351.1 two component Fis family sigma54 specific transcriptional regulator [Archangium gephyra]